MLVGKKFQVRPMPSAMLSAGLPLGKTGEAL